MDNPNESKDNKNFDKWRLVNFAFELGFIIALPLVAFALFGKWLDAKTGTEPWLTLIGILVAIISTTFWLTRRFRSLIK